ncbi:hypothetical protein H4S07_007105 [Coemansia furcata]|uniref:Uncharacterized protein n=1 Tax=Coemansia furcata TaxID=417177 RepID=A0ACC1KQS2_9FUNG|nr:hypothetical protein H4S07_007105 [Coemansia furcata]
MVLSEFFLISHTSVVTLSIAGMLKEVMMFGVAHLVFGDTMTLVNLCGLLVALFGIGMYNWLKIHDTLRNGKMTEARVTDESSSDLLEEARQRQVAFSGDSYNDAADLELSSSNDWAMGRFEDPVESGDSAGEDAGGGNKARRRHSVFNFGPKDSNASSSTSSANGSEPSSETMPNAAPGTRTLPPPISLNLNGIVTQDSINIPNTPKLKY